MDSPAGQDAGAVEEPAGVRPTRQRLLRAAAELIAELGWGRVTTRAVAERAGLPHGAVSYHFRGKQELLAEATRGTVECLAPVDELADVDSVAELMALLTRWLGDRDALDPVTTGVLLEGMRGSARDPQLREHMAGMLAEYRRLLTELFRTEQRRGLLPASLSPSGLASLLAAAGDGLLLHVLLDPELDLTTALGSLGTLLGQSDNVR